MFTMDVRIGRNFPEKTLSSYPRTLSLLPPSMSIKGPVTPVTPLLS